MWLVSGWMYRGVFCWICLVSLCQKIVLIWVSGLDLFLGS